MPRDPSGNYSLPAGNPVVTGTTIDAAWANTTLNDIAAELTASLSRDGEGGMNVPLLFSDGSAAAPGIGFETEPTTGFYRAGPGQIGVSGQTTATMLFDGAANSVTALGALTVQGAFTSRGIDDNATANAVTIDASQNVTLTDALTVGGSLAVSGATSLAAVTSSAAPSVNEDLTRKDYVDAGDAALQASVDANTAAVAAAAPTGVIQAYAGAVAPTGWLLCDGAAIPGGFTELIALIGPNTPDLRGEFLRGWSDNVAQDPDAPRAALSSQVEAVGPHRHGTDVQQVNEPNWDGANSRGGNQVAGRAQTTENSGVETRPKNVAVVYIIKT